MPASPSALGPAPSRAGRRTRRPGRRARRGRTRRPASARPRAARAAPRARAGRAAPRAGRGCAAAGVGAASSRTRAPAGRSRMPDAPRAAAGDVGGRRPRSSRTVSWGSSATTVPVPTITASTSARRRVDLGARLRPGDPAARAVGGRDPPVEGGRRLPRDERPARAATAKVQVSLSAMASLRSSPPSTSRPAARSTAAPPAATGFGSVWA